MHCYISYLLRTRYLMKIYKLYSGKLFVFNIFYNFKNWFCSIIQIDLYRGKTEKYH